MLRSLVFAAAAALVLACGPDSDDAPGDNDGADTADDGDGTPTIDAAPPGPPDADLTPDADTTPDDDMDGVTVGEGDCDDTSDTVFPGATEVCNGVDDDCNGTVDDGFDADMDGFTTCGGDCDDMNDLIHPDAPELCDGIDNNCAGGADENFDADMDGFTVCEGDCNDNFDGTYPGAMEICDFADNNCDTMVDEGLDADMDGLTACAGDCNDNDPTIKPGLPEIADGKDNDCNGGIDEPFTDDDGDGYTEATGDCVDSDPLMNPGALEFPGDMLDNDCDGTTDEPLVPCDGGALSSTNPADYAKAMGLCNGELVSAQFIGGNNPARAIVTGFGSHTGSLNRPVEGNKMAVLTNGLAATTPNHDPGTAFDGNTNLSNCTSTAHPAPGPDPGACGGADPASVCDYTELRLVIKVPTNAQSFKYRFQFYSSEYPTYRCTIYDDTFLAILNSGAFNGNISFDNLGKVVSINTGFFDICNSDNPNVNGGPSHTCTQDPTAPLASTGYEPDNGGLNSIGAGATTLLTTTAPVVKGETITLRFIIFDEGDDILDSTVLLDGFEWSLQPAMGPVTEQ